MSETTELVSDKSRAASYIVYLAMKSQQGLLCLMEPNASNGKVIKSDAPALHTMVVYSIHTLDKTVGSHLPTAATYVFYSTPTCTHM